VDCTLLKTTPVAAVVDTVDVVVLVAVVDVDVVLVPGFKIGE
jgi:hypothetical protein